MSLDAISCQVSLTYESERRCSIEKTLEFLSDQYLKRITIYGLPIPETIISFERYPQYCSSKTPDNLSPVHLAKFNKNTSKLCKKAVRIVHKTLNHCLKELKILPLDS